MSLDTAGLRVLDRDECLQHLATVRMGRVAVSHRAMPLILPVHFQLDGDRIVVHTQVGTTLDRTTDVAVVAFEAEGPVGAAEPTWSVVVLGTAVHVAPCTAQHSKRQRIEIPVDLVTGRQVVDEVPAYGQGHHVGAAPG